MASFTEILWLWRRIREGCGWYNAKAENHHIKNDVIQLSVPNNALSYQYIMFSWGQNGKSVLYNTKSFVRMRWGNRRWLKKLSRWMVMVFFMHLFLTLRSAMSKIWLIAECTSTISCKSWYYMNNLWFICQVRVVAWTGTMGYNKV